MAVNLAEPPLVSPVFTHVETSMTFTSWRDITYNKSGMGYDYKLLALEIKSNCLKQNFPLNMQTGFSHLRRKNNLFFLNFILTDKPTLLPKSSFSS